MKKKALGLTNWFGVGVSFATLFVFSIGDNVRGAIYPDLLNHFAVGTGFGSLFFLIASGVAVFFQFIAPRLLSGMQRQFYLLYVLFLICMGLGPGLQALVSFGLGPIQGSFEWILVGSFIFGIGMGGSSIFHGILLQSSVPKEKVARSFSILHSLYGAGAFLSPFLVTQLRQLEFSWASSLGFVFCLAILLATLTAGLNSWLPQVREHKPRADQELIENDLTPPQAEDRKWVSWAIFALAFCVATEILISSRMTLFLREALNFSPALAELYLSGFFLCLFAGRVFAAFKLTEVPFGRLTQWLSTICLLALVGALALHPILFLLVGFFMGPLFPLSLGELSRRDSASFGKDSSLLYGWVGIGIFSMHGLFGMIASQFGLLAAMSLGVGFLVITLIGYRRMSLRLAICR